MAMPVTSEMERWVRDPAARARAARRARWQEAICALLAAGCAIGAIWCFLGPSEQIGYLSRAQAGGIALLCVIAFMAGGAQAGISRRFLDLLDALDATRRR